MSWLRLKQSSDWIPHPYWICAKCFGTLIWCEWLYGSTPCENILRGYLCVFDLVFSHMMEFTVLNSQASFWRSLAEISLFL